LNRTRLPETNLGAEIRADTSMQLHDTGYARFVTNPSRRRRDCADYLDLLRRMIIDFDAVEDRFFVDATVVRLPDARIINSHSSGFRSERTRAMVRDSDDRALYICLEGGARISHRGRDIVLRAGETTLISSSDPLRIERDLSKQIIVAVPRSVLSGGGIDDSLMRRMDAGAEPLRLLRSYVDTFTDNPGLARPEYGGLIASQIQDLMQLVLGANRRAAEIASGRGIRSARMRAIKTDIARKLAGDVSATALAARHGISRRYVHALFEQEGTTLSRFVTGQRLSLVKRALRDPAQSHLAIGTIAFDAGFNDLSGFNRAFRREFGLTPREYRTNPLRDRC
jgi:AraC-like DNA-binding protein